MCLRIWEQRDDLLFDNIESNEKNGTWGKPRRENGVHLMQSGEMIETKNDSKDSRDAVSHNEQKLPKPLRAVLL